MIKSKLKNNKIFKKAIEHKKLTFLLVTLLILGSIKYIGIFEPAISIEDKPRVVIFLLDGAVGEIVYEMADTGELPNIKEHLYDRGLVVENALSVFPSVTGTAHIPIISGENIDKHNIPALRWFSRKELIYRDYVGPGAAYINLEIGDVKTLGELFPYKKVFFVFEAINKGVYDLYPLDIEVLPMKTGWHKLADRAAIDGALTRFIKGRKPPDISLIWFPGPDKAIHHYGPDAKEYREELVYVDKQIGRFIKRLKELGIYENTTLILVSDHGGYTSGNHDVLSESFKEKGFKVLDLATPRSFLPDIPYLAIPMSFPKEIADLIDWRVSPDFDMVVAVTGNGMSFIYVRDLKDGWRESPSLSDLRNYGLNKIDIVKDLVERESVDLVFIRENGTYYIFSSRGNARFDSKKTDNTLSFRYEVVEGEDPLNYSNSIKTRGLIGKWISEEEWFDATYDHYYPDILYQISSVFESDRVGDIIVTARHRWSFRREFPEAFHGDHGLPTRDNIVVPLIVSGPKFKHELIKKGRTSDVIKYVETSLS